ISYTYYCYAPHRHPHSFPTRRSSDLPQRAPGYVDALPERVRSKQNPRACLPEASQQVVALPFALHEQGPPAADRAAHRLRRPARSEEHTSELQSLAYLVCRLLLEKKK